MARSLNRVQLIGNLTRDPELRYTPNGSAVCSFGLATNRTWKKETGEKHEEAEFHNIVAWNKLAELCSQFLVKGRKVYVEGRLSTRSWTAQDGNQRTRTEIVISDMILLDSRRVEGELEEEKTITSPQKAEKATEKKPSSAKTLEVKKDKKIQSDEATDEVVPDDIPF
ncbi:single-stranded DNA-binding protein [Candidatus Roizmanbacteria bacterium]|nr:single-stranded DNA-binding protein [Candidatus Roizmanbacteria bacterium]